MNNNSLDINPNNSGNSSTATQSTVDLNYLTELCDGDQDFMNSIIDGFIADVPRIVQQLVHQVANSEWLPASKTAHQIKPSMQFIGLPDTLKLLRDVELFCRDQIRLSEIPLLVSTIDSNVQAAVQELKIIRSR